jgi:hypothetical protein
MSRGVVNAAWYRFRATFGHRWRGYLSLVLLIALVGGLAMAGVAAARRTQSSFSTFLAGTNPSAFTVSLYGASVQAPTVAPSTSADWNVSPMYIGWLPDPS